MQRLIISVVTLIRCIISLWLYAKWNGIIRNGMGLYGSDWSSKAVRDHEYTPFSASCAR